jgi:hypothetical protein
MELFAINSLQHNSMLVVIKPDRRCDPNPSQLEEPDNMSVGGILSLFRSVQFSLPTNRISYSYLDLLEN